MSQYFAIVNVDANEYVRPPGPSGARETVTNSQATGLLAYLMLEGPCDGTQFHRLADEDDPEIQAAIEERIRAEIEREERRFEEYLAADPDEWPWKLSDAPDPQIEKTQDVRSFARNQARSTYKDDDGHWDRNALFGVVVANFDINEIADYAGRWATDEIRIVGDYAERSSATPSSDVDVVDEGNAESLAERRDSAESTASTQDYATSDLYHEIKPDMRISLKDRDLTVEVDHLRTPIVEDSWNQEDIVCSHLNRDLQEGDWVTVRSGDHEDLDDDTYGVVTDIDTGVWTDISDPVLEEFRTFVGKEWFENQVGVMTPDVMLSVEE